MIHYWFIDYVLLMIIIIGPISRVICV